MVGISFPGISQLFVGGAQPPHLAAIAPLSVIADIYRSPGFPGGIFNNGFAQTWLQERADDAQPAPEGGQPWAIKRVNEGDQTCLANQRLRLQTQDPVEVTRDHPFYTPSLMDDRSPINWVDGIQVPIFLAGAWQDEQTGGDFVVDAVEVPEAAATSRSRVTNGVHTSSLDPDVLWNWIAFLDLYVAHQVPDPGRVAPIAPIIYPQILGRGHADAAAAGRPLRRHHRTTARPATLFESDPRVRVLMENGAGSSMPGLPAPTFELAFSKWPPREVRPTAWYFGPDGTLTRSKPGGGRRRGRQLSPRSRRASAADPAGRRLGQCVGAAPAVRLATATSTGTAVAYATAPLDRRPDHRRVRAASISGCARAPPDTDIQVTLTRDPARRPRDLRAERLAAREHAEARARKRSTRLEPRPTYLEQRRRPLPAGKFTKVRVGLFAAAHTFRAGSRIRISIEAPGGDRTRWAFDTPSTDGHGAERRLAHAVATVPADARRRARCPRSADAPAVPEPSRPAVPHLRAGGERRLAAETISR